MTLNDLLCNIQRNETSVYKRNRYKILQYYSGLESVVDTAMSQ